MPKVLNAHKVGVKSNNNRIYVGRPTKYGNRYIIGKDGTRQEVIDKYIKWFLEQSDDFIVNTIRELRGKDLICWCPPAGCHADLLLEIVNSIELEEI